MTRRIERPAANEQVTRELFQHLVDAFEEFINSHPDGYVGFTDHFMAAHNFHVWSIQNIEMIQGADHRQKLVVRKAAIDTFKQSLERKE